jgi:hypothetical protein
MKQYIKSYIIGQTITHSGFPEFPDKIAGGGV